MNFVAHHVIPIHSCKRAESFYGEGGASLDGHPTVFSVCKKTPSRMASFCGIHQYFVVRAKLFLSAVKRTSSMI
jgi:hypothetical protein